MAYQLPAGHRLAAGGAGLPRVGRGGGGAPPLRPYLAVLAVENEVLWIPRLCASERLRLNAVPAGSVRLQVPSGDPYR